MWIEAEGSCDDGIWQSLDLVEPLEPPGLPDGWNLIRGNDRRHIARELDREIPPGHVLHGVRITPLARHEARDDVLVRAGGAPMPLYLVHLTWRQETDPAWPAAHPFQSMADFAIAEGT
ncbi:Hypothetical protein A7982_07390 [Minicystis rosea]|nr:Hypothetical protein A7982_07390 [Minicystis rosea]